LKLDKEQLIKQAFSFAMPTERKAAIIKIIDGYVDLISSHKIPNLEESEVLLLSNLIKASISNTNQLLEYMYNVTPNSQL